MAWSSAPLTKPGNHRCPRCGRGLFFHVSWGRSAWRCPKCQSLLEWDSPRHQAAMLIGLLVQCASFLPVVLTPNRPSVLYGTVAVGIVIITFIHWWLASIIPVEQPPGSPSAPDKPPGTT